MLRLNKQIKVASQLNCIDYVLETEETLVKLQTNLKELEEQLKTEQQNVADVKLKIEEYKAMMAAQNKEIAKRQADKEQRETQVN